MDSENIILNLKIKFLYNDWRVPTSEEINTLFDSKKVSREWIIVYGINGRKFTDRLGFNGANGFNIRPVK